MAPQARMPDQSPDQGIADAVRGNWVDRFAPRGARPYLRLARADRPIGTWLLYIPCLWAVSLAANGGGGFGRFDLWIILSCGIGAFLMRGAGCTWNDITDRHIDGSVERTRLRPIPAGQVTVVQACLWMAGLALVSLLILLTYNRLAIMLGILSLVPVGIYPFAKRFTWWPQVFLGLAFNWGALLAWAAHAGQVSAGALVLYAAGIFWTLFYDTIYAHQDKEDDALIGVKSTARLFADASRQWLYLFILLTSGLFALAILLTIPAERGAWPTIVSLLGVGAFAGHMIRQMRGLDLDDSSACLHAFRSNRDAGLVAVPFLAAAAFL